MSDRFRVRSSGIASTTRILIIAGALMLALAGGVRAEGPSRAGLVVVFAPDDVYTTCVTFDSELTGLELLQRAGLTVIQAGAAGVGESVCKIEGVGCAFPAEHCFCQCLSTPCIYWSYWYWQDGDWAFSQWGAASRRVRDGAMEAWVWGDGQTKPPAVNFASICASPPQLSSPASQDGYPGPLPTAPPTPYPGPDDGQEEPTPEPEPSLTPEPSPTEEEIPLETPTPQEQPATPEPDAAMTATPTPRATPTRVTPTATATATPATPSPTPGPSATPTDDGMAAAIATAVARQRAAPPAAGDGSGVGSYVAFGLLALVLVALIVYAVLLRRQRARRQTE
jgi:hypothetical protein